MKTLIKDIPNDQIISVGDLSKYIIQDRNRSIQEYVNEQVAFKRQTPMKCWSMDEILQLVTNKFGESANAFARRYLIKDIFNLNETK